MTCDSFIVDLNKTDENEDRVQRQDLMDVYTCAYYNLVRGCRSDCMNVCPCAHFKLGRTKNRMDS